jgi:hypothetical protein
MDETCILCGREAPSSQENEHHGNDFDTHLCRVVCQGCGEYIVSERLALETGSQGTIFGVAKHLWSGVTRNSWELNRQRYTLTHASTERGLPYPLPETVSGLADHLLKVIGRMATLPLDGVPLVFDRDYALLYAERRDALHQYLKHLRARGLLTHEGSAGGWESRLTPAGWDKYESLVGTPVDSEQAFVAMWFAKRMDPIFDNAIERAICGAGWSPYRVDRDEHTERIDDKILVEIKESRFMVADFTGQRRSVYFEAGLAKGMGLDVIWTCREDRLKSLAFDARQYNFLPWTKDALPAFQEALTNRILVLHGRGPRSSGKVGDAS